MGRGWSGVGKVLLLSTDFILGPDVILNTKIHKTFGSHNGPLTQSMHHSENTKIKLITMIKQRRVLNLLNTYLGQGKLLSHTYTILTTIHHDSTRMMKS